MPGYLNGGTASSNAYSTKNKSRESLGVSKRVSLNGRSGNGVGEGIGVQGGNQSSEILNNGLKSHANQAASHENLDI